MWTYLNSYIFSTWFEVGSMSEIIIFLLVPAKNLVYTTVDIVNFFVNRYQFASAMKIVTILSRCFVLIISSFLLTMVSLSVFLCLVSKFHIFFQLFVKHCCIECRGWLIDLLARILLSLTWAWLMSTCDRDVHYNNRYLVSNFIKNSISEMVSYMCRLITNSIKKIKHVFDLSSIIDMQKWN